VGSAECVCGKNNIIFQLAALHKRYNHLYMSFDSEIMLKKIIFALLLWAAFVPVQGQIIVENQAVVHMDVAGSVGAVLYKEDPFYWDYHMTLKWAKTEDTEITFEPGTPTEVAMDPVNKDYVAVLDANALISDKLDWKWGEHLKMASFKSKNIIGIWAGQQKKYIGIRMKRSDGYHYAWMNVSVSFNAQTFDIYQCAYELTPDKPIGGGQTVGIGEETAPVFSILKQEDVLRLKSFKGKSFEVTVINMSGQQVFKGSSVTDEMKVSTEGFIAGVYVVVVQSSEGRKIVKIQF
jgi:hypothetical protein